MSKIFLSYRRDDSRKDVGRIYDKLADAFGEENVFRDIDTIPIGTDFRDFLQEAIAHCSIVLIIIGRNWLNITDGKTGQRRIDNPGDFVRIEVEAALVRKGVTVIPVLVDGASMPGQQDLPAALCELALINATIVRDDPDFHNDMERLIKVLRVKLGSTQAKPQIVQPERASRRGFIALISSVILVMMATIGVVLFPDPFNILDTPPATSTTTPSPSKTPTEAIPTATYTVSPLETAQPWTAGDAVYINVENAWLRENASVSAIDSIAMLPRNARVLLTGIQFYEEANRQMWWQVTAANGKTGWIEQKSLTTIGPTPTRYVTRAQIIATDVTPSVTPITPTIAITVPFPVFRNTSVIPIFPSIDEPLRIITLQP